MSNQSVTEKRQEQLRKAAQRWRDKQKEEGRQKITGIVSATSAAILENLRTTENKTNGTLLDEAIGLLGEEGSHTPLILTETASDALQAIIDSTGATPAVVVESALTEALRRQREEEERDRMESEGDF